jgi:hypothetical protein
MRHDLDHEMADEEGDENRRRRYRTDDSVLVTVALIAFGVLILFSARQISNATGPTQQILYGLFGATIFLAFGQLLLLFRQKMTQTRVEEKVDRDVTRKLHTVYDKVNGATERRFAELQAQHDSALTQKDLDHERALAELKVEHQRERHKVENEKSSWMRQAELYQAEAKTFEMQVRDLQERLARCADKGTGDKPC